ncbi:MAG TPA: multifunctional CCA tRNA nucleotidyl transferase/2'3'-cyclic phosphodiesterase/2'nucleotidase/phosphatase, partial [Alcanivorax sp.]|nr:multifunctional CCA tRNA nucleotidyl transferase/2'3'-cyclic phosphodiesterase/2'nucleotidase/phosphatase [Alcanivorax sp.]
TPPDGWPEHRGHERRGMHVAKTMSQRLRVPKEMTDAAMTMARWQSRVQRVLK